MTGTANPVDLITGLASTASVAKADISAWAKARVPQVMADANEIRSTNLAAQLSGDYDASKLESLPALFLKIFWWGAIGGGLMLLLTPWLKRLMPGVK